MTAIPNRPAVRAARARYRARFAEDAADLARARSLRQRIFRAGGGEEGDAYDLRCRHVLIERSADGALVCCLRLMPLGSGREIGTSYAAQFYDLEGLRGYDRPMLELGRFCTMPGLRDPDVLRLALGAVTEAAEASEAGLLFGCSSFAGTDAAPYDEAFALLAERHLAPPRWRPQPKAPLVLRFAHALRQRRPALKADLKAALKAMPPLLRSYLALGGWVSDHAVIDRDLNTLHVFTGVEVARIPTGRARVLRATGA